MGVLDVSFDGRTAVLTLNRPESLNALNTELIEALADALRRVQRDPSVWTCILTGNGRAFCAGGDLKQIASRTEPRGDAFWQPAQELFTGMGFSKPLIGALNGYTLGGGLEVAMLCDIRIAAEGISLGLPEARHATIPGGGGVTRIVRLAPFGHAVEMLAVGHRISAEEAWRIGLVNRVVPASELMDAAFEMARLIERNAPLAVQAAKDAAYRGMDLTLQEGLHYERLASQVLSTTEDAQEGPRAFADKREPRYQGR